MEPAVPQRYGQSQPFPNGSRPPHAGPPSMPIDIPGTRRMEEDPRHLPSWEDNATRVINSSHVSYFPRISKRRLGGHGEGEDGGSSKRRRARHEIYPADSDDDEGPTAGPKDWTEDEKDRLFRWLLAPENDAHFNDMMADKHSCLRTVRLPSFRVKIA
jgi:hypothetical protein